MSGKDAGRLPVVAEDPMAPSSLPTPDSYKFFSEWEKKSNWKNDVTVRRYVIRFTLLPTSPRSTMLTPLVSNYYEATIPRI